MNALRSLMERARSAGVSLLAERRTWALWDDARLIEDERPLPADVLAVWRPEDFAARAEVVFPVAAVLFREAALAAVFGFFGTGGELV